MSEQNAKYIKTRIVHKHDIADNWALAVNFRPKQGELIIYDDRYTNSEGNEIIVADRVRYKIGDGTTLVNELPFIDVGHESIGNNKVSYDIAKSEAQLNSVYTGTLETTISTIVNKILSTKEVAYSGSYNDLVDKPNTLSYCEDTLKAGETAKTVKLPEGSVPLIVQTRDSSGAIVMTDSVITTGGLEDIDVATFTGNIKSAGIYKFEVTEENSLYVTVRGSYTRVENGEIVEDEPLDGYHIPMDYDEDEGVYTLEVKETDISVSLKEYPAYGDSEGDYSKTEYYVDVTDMSEASYGISTITKITKIIDPSVSVSISEPLDQDINITVIYQGSGYTNNDLQSIISQQEAIIAKQNELLGGGA